MCGIAGYIGTKNASEKIFEMLKRLEYRGYDSAGVAVARDRIMVFKDAGRVAEVKSKARLPNSELGIGHTRWATHGMPNKVNAHPHCDCTGDIAIIHNGIIENYQELKKALGNHKFVSETDTEVVAHLIEAGTDKGMPFEDAFSRAVKQLKGSFALVAISSRDKGKIMVARNESPLVVGIGRGEMFIASDIPAVLPETREVVVLEDMEMATVTRQGVLIRDIGSGREVKRAPMHIDMDVVEAEKGGYAHFMLKEIMEEPDAIKNALRGLGRIREIAQKIKKGDAVCFVGCGTAYHACMVGRYVLQELGVNARAEMASEFRYSGVKTPADLLVAVSQSGETADTVAAIKKAKEKGMRVIAIVNVVGSTIARMADEVIYTYSGPEIAVASTKAYIGHVTSILLFSLLVGRRFNVISEGELDKMIEELKGLPKSVIAILEERDRIKDVAKRHVKKRCYFFIGRTLDFPTAMEGALKLKEISYKNAEGYPAGELKHGPLALLDRDVCVVAIIPEDELRKKMLSNVQEVRSREAELVLVENSGSTGIDEKGAETVIRLEKTQRFLFPILSIVPLHLFAYYIALLLGYDIDKPRNLAKSVTVE